MILNKTQKIQLIKYFYQIINEIGYYFSNSLFETLSVDSYFGTSVMVPQNMIVILIGIPPPFYFLNYNYEDNFIAISYLYDFEVETGGENFDKVFKIFIKNLFFSATLDKQDF